MRSILDNRFNLRLQWNNYWFYYSLRLPPDSCLMLQDLIEVILQHLPVTEESPVKMNQKTHLRSPLGHDSSSFLSEGRSLLRRMHH